MPCISQTCNQGRKGCSTPHKCGLMTQAGESDEPIYTPEDAMGWPTWVAVCAIAVIFAALMLPNLVMEQWPRLVSLMGSV